MAFGLNSPPSTSNGLNFKWDYNSRLKSNDTMRLHSHWQDLLREGRDAGLMPKELEDLEAVQNLLPNEIEENIQDMFDKDVKLFTKVRNQIHSTMMLWERIYHQKLRFDEEGVMFEDGEDYMTKEACLMAFKLIPRRALIGLPFFETIQQGKQKSRSPDVDPRRSKKRSKVDLSDDEEPDTAVAESLERRKRIKIKLEEMSDSGEGDGEVDGSGDKRGRKSSTTAKLESDEEDVGQRGRKRPQPKPELDDAAGSGNGKSAKKRKLAKVLRR